MQKRKTKANNEGNKRLITKVRIFFYVICLLIFGFVIYYFSEIKQEFRMLKKLNSYWLLLALFLQLLTYLFNAFIYQLLLRTYRVSGIPRLSEFYKISVISLFFNQTIPSAGISGNTFLFSYLEKKKITSPLILSLILIELLTFYAAIEFIILVFIVFSFVYKLSYVFHAVLIGGLLVYSLFGIAVTVMGRKKTFDLLYKKLGKKKLFRGFFQRVKSDFESKKSEQNSIELLPLIKNKKAVLAKAFFLQLLLFAADLFTIVALFNGLGEKVSIAFASLGLISAKIISLLPFSPGSLILYESSMTFFFARLGIPLGPAIIVTLIYRFLSFWLPIPAGLILYRHWLSKKD